MQAAAALEKLDDFEWLDGLQEPLLILDSAAKIVFGNSAAAVVTGCSQRKMKKGVPLSDVIRFPDSVRFLQSTGERSTQQEAFFPYCGQTKQIFVSLRSRVQSGDNIFILSFRDLTLEDTLHHKMISHKVELARHIAGLEKFAFLIICILFGLSALTLRYSVESIPPLMMVGTREIISGIIFALIFIPRDGLPRSTREWRALLMMAGLDIVAFGTLAIAMKTVPSGIAAVIVATAPVWIYFLEIVFKKLKPSLVRSSGFAAALLGVGLLMASSGHEMAITNQLYLILLSSMAWAASMFINGSTPGKPFVMLSLDMVLAGLAILAISYFTGEWSSFAIADVSEKSRVAFLYQLVFRNLIGVPVALWLRLSGSQSQRSSFLYVNPVIALTVGWLLGKEYLSLGSLLSCAILLGSVVLIVRGKKT